MPPPSTPIDGVVEKKTFTLQSYVTVRGETIKNVKIGWESYGSLNTDKSIGILITQGLITGRLSPALKSGAPEQPN